jgi:hypothetical protein
MHLEINLIDIKEAVSIEAASLISGISDLSK